jgi:UDP-3-O-acyl-N-acetylglucosamine deacetylase
MTTPSPGLSPPPPTSSQSRFTLAAPVRVEGLTLFTGATSHVTLRPAVAGEGLAFLRADAPGSALLLARCDFISPPSPTEPQARRTTLAAPGERRGGSIQTVEHLLSALVGMGITDALIEVFGPELPVGDGSAKLFTDALTSVGVRPLTIRDPASLPAPAIVREPITLNFPDGSSLEALPHAAPECVYTYHLDYPPGSGIEPPIQEVSLTVPLSGPASGYLETIAPARTYSLQAEAEAARALGMFKHLSPADMLVIGPAGPIDNAYRFPDEPSRHKLLDLIGDLALAGRPIQARIIARKTGHAHNHELARRLAAI